MKDVKKIVKTPVVFDTTLEATGVHGTLRPSLEILGSIIWRLVLSKIHARLTSYTPFSALKSCSSQPIGQKKSSLEHQTFC